MELWIAILGLFLALVGIGIELNRISDQLTNIASLLSTVLTEKLRREKLHVKQKDESLASVRLPEQCGPFTAS